MRVSQLNKSSQ